MSNLVIDKKIYEIQKENKILNLKNREFKKAVWDHFEKNLFESVPDSQVSKKKKDVIWKQQIV